MTAWLTLLWTLIVLLIGAWRLTYTAARLDRLHARVEGSLAALDAQLVRRAEVALEVGQRGGLDAASSFLLVAAASASLEAAEEALITEDVQEVGIPPHRAEVESELTDALTGVGTQWEPDTPSEVELRRRAADACVRVELARRFHNQAVRDVQRVRAKWFVRLFRLAGHTVLPEQVGFDDKVMGLETTASAW